MSTVLGYIYDYIKDNNKINFEFDPTIYYCEEDKILIEDSIKKLGEEKVQSIKKSLPDTIQYEAIRAVIIEKYITQNI